ncbi:MAG: DUF5658 family protein [Planctomycetota bacterium]
MLTRSIVVGTEDALIRLKDQELDESKLKLRLLWGLIVLSLVDGLQTIIAVAEHGTIAEANPIMRMVIVEMDAFGIFWFKTMAVLVVILTIERVRVKVLVGAVLLMAAVVTSNLCQMLAA